MTRKRKDSGFTHRVKGAAGLAKRTAELRSEGYVMLTPGLNPHNKDRAERSRQWGDYIHASLRGAKEDGSSSRSDIPTVYFSSGSENMAGAENIGTKGLGWIEWGLGNELPNKVALLTHMMPYTASALKFSSDLCAGIGPQPMYDCTQYVGGALTQRAIRYKDAGRFLQGLIVDKQRELLKISKEMDEFRGLKWQDNEEDYPASPAFPLPDGKDEDGEDNHVMSEETRQVYQELMQQCKDQIAQYKRDLKEWERTYPQVQEFLDRNNLAQTWLSITIDQMLFGISFPELLLNKLDVDAGGKPVQTSLWNPRVVGISNRSCHTTRLERMDNNGNINYVYCSQQWLDKPFLDESAEEAGITVLPALNKQNPLSSLEERVRKARMDNVKPNDRPTRFVMPSVYPSAGRPYYPTPPWQSIFGGDIYEYLSTIISDRFNRKKNSNVIGRVIYLHLDYLNQIFTRLRATGDTAKQDEVRNQLYTQINEWLANRDNAGQSLLAFTFTGTDGKEHKSFEIIEIESNSAQSAAANEKETAEIASVVFMAWGLDGKLLGSNPLTLLNGGGGTDLRERYLLRMILMSPTQQIMLKPLEVASRFNGWDRKLFWQIPREVITSLESSRSGLKQENSNA